MTSITSQRVVEIIFTESIDCLLLLYMPNLNDEDLLLKEGENTEAFTYCFTSTASLFLFIYLSTLYNMEMLIIE